MKWSFNKILEEFFSFTVLFLIVSIFFTFNYCGKKETIKEPVSSGTFAIKYGIVMCGKHYIDNCGVHLLMCDNEKEYHCMLDVQMELDKLKE